MTPVAHPYVHGPPHAPAPVKTPFVRWPEHHVYARDHGDRLGLGTYDHQPLQVAIDDLGGHAEQPWATAIFDPAIPSAMSLMPTASRFVPQVRLNGVFAMTPDNLPLLGRMPEVGGLWVAEALWVTHAAGAARALSRQLTGGSTEIEGLEALRPDRFAGQPLNALTECALRLYRDIYATAEARTQALR